MASSEVAGRTRNNCAGRPSGEAYQVEVLFVRTIGKCRLEDWRPWGMPTTYDKAKSVSADIGRMFGNATRIVAAAPA